MFAEAESTLGGGTRPFLLTHGGRHGSRTGHRLPVEAGVHSALRAGFLRGGCPLWGPGHRQLPAQRSSGGGWASVLLLCTGLGSSARAWPVDGHRDGGGRQGPLSRLEGSPSPALHRRAPWSGPCVLPAGQGTLAADLQGLHAC